jgi:hypothetical protein
LFVFDARAPSGAGPPHTRGSQITHNDAPQSVGLLWTSDQLVAEIYTLQHTTLTRDRHPCPRWDSNPVGERLKNYALDAASRRFRQLTFLDSRYMKVATLSALSTGRFYSGKFSWYSFLLVAESTQGPYCDMEDYVEEKSQ